MVERVSDGMGTEGVLGLMHPLVAKWFRAKFGGVTEAQAVAVPVIHARESVLVSSPTGSGKTLTAFMSIINELALLDQRGELEDRIYAVYVSPLKALANDINENLLRPLEEISAEFERAGSRPPGIRVAVRTGDTLPAERQRQLRSPPHIFITTPESLSLVLSTPAFSKKFGKVEYVVVDEVHEVCDSKRGVALSVALERLRGMCGRDFVRIGLSATVAPLEEVAEFLAGLEGGRPRPVKVVEIFGQRDLDLRVLCPADDMTALSFEVVNSKMYDHLKEMVDGHRTTLVFTNTRSGTESVVYKLRERGLEAVGAHHGSLSRDTRLEVEDQLRGGALSAVVSSTSLELGIDIGHIDLVVQIGSPKSVAKGLQRIGRAGHQYGGTSKGRILVFENDDLVECAVLCRAAHRKAIDRVTIPRDSLDVLAQAVVGMSIERQWTVDQAFELVTRSFCYRDLRRDQLLSVLRYLGGKDEFEGIYSKIWYDEGTGTFGRRRGSRMIYYLNQGTIPEEADYKVYSERGAPLGSLSEKFVERLSAGDIFVLGGRSYEFLRTKGTKAFVKGASGRRPTVPSWTGEMLPRSFDLSVMVGRFRREMDERLGPVPEAEIASWLMEEFSVDEGSANTIISYFKEQKAAATIPTDERLVIEGYVDASGERHAVFHFPFGRRVNDALSRAYAHALSGKLRCSVNVSVTDDCFMLSAPKRFELGGLEGLVRSGDLEGMLRSAVKDSELFHQRFRHTATRSFMVLRNYKGRELSVARQQLRSRRLLDALHELSDFPVMAETYSEILTDVMDLDNARAVLRSIESGDRRVEHLPFSGVPSPMAHNVILVGVSDIVLMEDRSMLLREMHRKVLARVLGEDALSEYQFDPDEVAEHFRRKFPTVSSKQDILRLLGEAGPMNLFREKGENVYAHTDRPFEEVRGWASELLREGKVRSVWVGEDVYAAADMWPTYLCLHSRAHRSSPLERAALALLSKGAMDQDELARSLSVKREDAREALRRLEIANMVHRSSVKGERFSYSASPEARLDRGECARAAIVRHLAFHAPLTVEELSYEVGLPEQEVSEALGRLVSDEAVVSGRFVVGEQQQYILAKDYIRLKAGDRPALDREQVRSYLERKSFSARPSVRGYFEAVGEAGMAYDVFHRVSGFSMDEFNALRASGALLLGRFARGRLRYVLAEDAPYYIGAFRRERLNRFEASILSALRRMGTGTYQEVSEAVRFPPDAMREHWDSLDRKGHVLRLHDGSEAWTSRNLYAPCDVEPVEQGALEHVLVRYLRGSAPVTLSQASSYLDVGPDVAKRLLAAVGARPASVGLERTEMYLLPEDIAGVEAPSGPDDQVRILSLYDPFLSDKWAAVTARYGEGWMFPVVHRGQVVGTVEKWLMAGAVEVRDIVLEDRAMLGPLLDALDRAMVFYASQNADVLRVRRALGTDAVSLDGADLEAFLSRGYVASNGMLVKGPVVPECFDRPEILDTVFSLQHFAEGDRLRDMDEVLDMLGGLRHDGEALARVERFEPIERMRRRGHLVRGHLAPDRSGFCRQEDAAVYRAARAGPRTPEERLILRVIKDQQPVTRGRLLTVSPLGPEETLKAAKSLYLRSEVFLDASNAYLGAKRTRMARHAAWDRVVRRMFGAFGVMTAETLAFMLSGDLVIREVRASLRRLESEGFLVRGHLLRGSNSVYWASREAYGRLGRASAAADVVLYPWDSLTTFLRAAYRDVLPETGRCAVFSGSRLVGSFEGHLRKGGLHISDVVGEAGCRGIIEDHARRMGLALSEDGGGSVSEWEIMEFYRKTHPGE
ncbi:MAG: ATP-dependent helicase [Candidatus Thermoplasmatota archaeon]